MSYVENYIPSNRFSFYHHLKKHKERWKMVVAIDEASGLLPRCGLSLMTAPAQENHQDFSLRNPQCKQDLTVDLEC